MPAHLPNCQTCGSQNVKRGSMYTEIVCNDCGDRFYLD